MRKSKNRIRFVLLVVLTTITLLVFWWIQPENRLDVDENIFRVEALDAVDRVELSTDSSNVTLAFSGNQWRVNDQYVADGSMIRVLFATLQQAQPKRALPESQRDSVFSRLSDSGVKVSLFQGQELKREFFAGGNAARSQAFFADPSTEQVYVMAIPGYRVYVSGILELEEAGWRDKYVFGFNWENFRSLEAMFPGRKAENFTVAMTRNFFGIEGMPEADTSKLNNFLDDVSLLTVEEYLSEPELSDSLQRRQPQLEIRVKDVGNRTYRLRMFDFGPRQEIYGLMQDSQVALFNRRKFAALLKPRSFFRKK